MFVVPNFMPKVLPDDEITEGVNFLNSEQREVFTVVRRAKDYIKYFFSIRVFSTDTDDSQESRRREGTIF